MWKKYFQVAVYILMPPFGPPPPPLPNPPLELPLKIYSPFAKAKWNNRFSGLPSPLSVFFSDLNKKKWPHWVINFIRMLKSKYHIKKVAEIINEKNVASFFLGGGGG